jgi:hypothetical protein
VWINDTKSQWVNRRREFYDEIDDAEALGLSFVCLGCQRAARRVGFWLWGEATREQKHRDDMWVHRVLHTRSSGASGNVSGFFRFLNTRCECKESVHLLSLYLSVKRSHHVGREGLEIPTLIQKREEHTSLDFMKFWRSRSIKDYINSELKKGNLKSPYSIQIQIPTLIQKR